MKHVYRGVLDLSSLTKEKGDRSKKHTVASLNMAKGRDYTYLMTLLRARLIEAIIICSKVCRERATRLREISFDIVNVTGRLPTVQKMLFGSGLVILFFAMALVKGGVALYHFQNIALADQDMISAPSLSELLSTDGTTTQDIKQSVEQIKEIITGLRDELPRFLALSPLGGTQISNVVEALDIVDGYTDVSLMLLPELASVRQMYMDYGNLSQEEFSNKYRNLTDYFAQHWDYIMGDPYERLSLLVARLDALSTKGLPGHVVESLSQLKQYSGALLQAMKTIDHYKLPLQTLLGGDGPKHYAILLENTNEARATGGFFGTILFVKVDGGYVKDMTLEDVYSVDGNILETLPAPKGIEPLNHELRLRDANYWPDFPTSAKQIAWFLDKRKGASVDGVFAITDRFVQDMLQDMDKVDIPIKDTSITLSTKDVMTVLSLLVESKVDNNDPKSPLKEMMNTLPGKLMADIIHHPWLMTAVVKAAQEKQIMAFSFDPQVQTMFEEIGISQDIVPYTEGQDAFMYVPTSVSGNKSDGNVLRHIIHHTEVREDKLYDTVTLVKHHVWSTSYEQYIKDLYSTYVGGEMSDELLDIMGRGMNKEYVRYYIPEGSTIVSTEGIDQDSIDISTDHGYTVLGFLESVVAGESSEISITYELPITISKQNYVLQLQKSPGEMSYSFQKSMRSDGDVHVANALVTKDLEFAQ